MQLNLLWAMAVLAVPQSAPMAADPVAQPPPLPVLIVRDSEALRIIDARLHYAGDELRLSGRVCRRTNWSGMQPSAFDIDRIAADGSRAEHADAYLPRLSLRIDQSCGYWQTRFKGPVAPGDKVVVCVPRSHNHCRVD